MAKGARLHHAGKRVSSTNGAGTIEHSWAKQANEQTKDSNDQNPSN